ncbi:MAG: phage tail protein [Paracoccus aminovorans]|nr:phage tail protein [Paracoccus aminovorans]
MRKILFLAVMVATIAGPAHADPISAIASVFTAMGAAASTAVALAQITFGLAMNLLSTAIAKAVADKPKVDVQFDVDFGDDTPLTFVVGDYATAGKLKYIAGWGKNRRFVTEVIEVSCLPQGYGGIWVGDEAGTPNGLRAYATGTFQPGQQSGWAEAATVPGGAIDMGMVLTNLSDDGNRICVKWVDGTQAAADPFLTWAFGSAEDYPWTSAMIGTGKAYAIVTTRYDSDSLTSKPSWLFKPAPLPMYDPRKDSTAGGSGAHRWGNRSTYEATRNPAVIAYNIARGIYYGSEWVFGGRNLPAWRLPLAEWFAAMNACDATVNLAGGGTEPAFRCGLQISADMSPADVLEEIGRAANMRFAEVGGMLKPIVGLPGAAAFAFTDESILITEGQSYKPFNGLGETYNALSATYPEPAEKWSTKDAPEYIATAATAADGWRYLPTSLSYPAAPYRRQVQRLMRAQMRDYRRMRLHQFYLPPEAYALEPLVDMVSWSSERNGYLNKLFVVEQVEPTPGMNVLVTLREVDPSDYDWSSDFELPTTVVTPVVVVPFVQAISGFAVAAETITDAASKARAPAIRVSCSGDEVGVTHIQIQVRKSGATDPYLDVQRPFNAPFAWRVLDVVQQTNYQVRARLISNLTPKGEWTTWVSVTTPAIYIDGGDFVDGVTGLFEDAGLKATRIINNLSEPGTEVGELAWNRADSRLYRWNGSAWVHFIQESVTGILDETAFAANIRVPKVSATLPTSGNRVGDMIYRTTDGTIYRWTGSAWTAEVAATQIVGQLIAGQIAAGAIGTEQLAARAVAARHMVISDFTNLVPDANIADAASWTNNGGWAIQTSGPAFTGERWAAVTVSNAAAAAFISDYWTVEQGSEYFASIQARGGASGQVIRLNAYVQWFKTDGSLISSSYLRTAGAGAIPFTITTYEGSFVAPSEATRARMVWSLDTSTGTAYVGSPIVRQKNAGKLIVDGTLQARHIEFETLTGGLMAPAGIITKAAQIDDAVIRNAHIENGTITNAKIGNAEIQGAKIANLTVDTINIKDGAVTVGHYVTLNGGSATTATDGFYDPFTFSMPAAGRALLYAKCTTFNPALDAANAAVSAVQVNGVDYVSSVRKSTAGGGGTTIFEGTIAVPLVAGSNTIRLRHRNMISAAWQVDVFAFKK